MRQKEIIEKLKAGAHITVHSGSRKSEACLICNAGAKYPDRVQRYILTYRQFQALYFKGIIEERFEESRISKDDYGNRIFSSFYYLVENK